MKLAWLDRRPVLGAALLALGFTLLVVGAVVLAAPPLALDRLWQLGDLRLYAALLGLFFAAGAAALLMAFANRPLDEDAPLARPRARDAEPAHAELRPEERDERDLT